MTVTDPALLAWRSDPHVKADTVHRMRAHRDSDAITQGNYGRFDDGRFTGCFHACLTLETLAAELDLPFDASTNNVLRMCYSGDGLRVEGARLWGIPAKLGLLLESLFERLPAGRCAQFAVDTVEAIPTGADLTFVVDRWILDLLADPEHGVARHVTDQAGQEAVRLVGDLFRRRLAGNEPDHAEWDDAAGYYADRPEPAGSAAGSCAADYAVLAASVAAQAALPDDDEDDLVNSAAGVGSYAGTAAMLAAGRHYIDTEALLWQADRLVHHLATAPVPAPALTGVSA